MPADIRYNHGDDPKPFRPSFFRGLTKEEREGKAHRLSENLNARLVIYGELEESEPVDMASFRFFMSDKLLVTGTFDYLQHFTGSHGLGKPFAYEFETSLDETNKQIDLRLRTLLWLTRAIQVYATDSTDALNLLDQAEKNILENYGERGEEPLELIYLLRGFIQIELKDPDAAAESFKTALEIRPDMHRARIGMGSVHFLNTFDFSQSEEDKLKEIDRAIEYYEGALEDISPDNTEEHTYAQLALGIGLTWRAYIRYTLQRPSEDIDPDIGLSDALLTPIVEHPDQISPGLIAYAYNALGVNEEIRIGLLKEQNLEPSLEDAQNYYRKCLDSVDETKHNTQGVADTRENCENRLKELEKAKNLSEETP